MAWPAFLGAVPLGQGRQLPLAAGAQVPFGHGEQRTLLFPAAAEPGAQATQGEPGTGL